MTEFQAEEQSRRELLLWRWTELKRTHSGNKAAQLLGQSHATLARWLREGVVPKQAERCGRRPLAVLDHEHRVEVQKLVTQTDPNTGTKISTSMALRVFAHSDKCPQDVADVILKKRKSKHTLTPTLKRQAKVTPETKMLYRGNKNFALNAFSQPRSLTWIDLDGKERPILAGDIFEPDDMTLNQPWYVEWQPDPAEAGLESARAAERFGVRTLRGQLLVMIDVGSQRILGFLLLARLQDSYRAEDVWSWFGQIFRDIGLPRVGIRLEGGSWRSNTVLGLPIVDQTWSGERRLGGLSELGVRVIPSFSPKTKSIEIVFNNLQKVLGCTGVQVGRRRGEFEQATKDYLRCRAGKMHPADAGFLHADELVKRIANACMFLNQDCREGEVYRGVPDELWARDVIDLSDGLESPVRAVTRGEPPDARLKASAKGPQQCSRAGQANNGSNDERSPSAQPLNTSTTQPLRALPADKSWIFMREKRELTIRNGMVRARYEEHECSYYFTNPELFARLGRGYRVIVCFDPAMPEMGAVVFNRETGARSGPGEDESYAPGELLGTAEFVDRVPQFSAGDGFDDERGYERRRRFTAQCRKAYRAIPLPGRRAAAATEVRHGRNEVRIEQFSPEANTARPVTDLQAAGCGSRANPASPASGLSDLTDVGHVSPRPANSFDEAEELDRIAKLERAAIERGEIIPP